MKIILTETQLNKLISEQEYIDTNSRPVSFTEDDREMLQRIYDVVVRGGASGGYGGVRRRAIPALVTLPDTKAY